VPPLSHYATPANWGEQDFKGDPEGLKAFTTRWNWNLNQFTRQAIVGNPWMVANDSNRNLYFDPLTFNIPAGVASAPVQWPAFPNRLTAYLGALYSPADLARFADNGPLDGHGQLLGIPSVACPAIDPSSTKIPFPPIGPRGWQDEYCEWAVQRDPASNKITRVMFTCENPEYWYALWAVNPDRVCDLYRSLLGNAAISFDDLCLKDPATGAPVIDPLTGRPAYDPINKWNSGTQLLPDRGGAIHLTSPPNTLGAEIYLAAAATIQREGPTSSQELICCSQYGQPFRNSDPFIGFSVNTLVGQGNTVSLTDPVGLYIQTPDWSRFAAPGGADPSQFWKVLRGNPHGEVLHVVYEVPQTSGFTVSDITIDGEVIAWAAQITRAFKMGLSAWEVPSSQPANPEPCPSDLSAPLAAPQQLMDYKVFRAYYDSDRSGVSPATAPVVRTGQRYEELVLLVAGGQQGATVTVEGGGVDIEVTGFEVYQYHRPGQTMPGAIPGYRLNLTVQASAQPGQRGIGVTNPGQAPAPAAPCLLTITPAS
jgi:hypothetical protein